MRHSSSFVIGLVASIILGFVIIGGVWLGLSSATVLGYEPPVLQATTANGLTLNLSTYPDSHVCHPNAPEPQYDWVTYCNSTNLQVPANSTITVIIKNYDSTTPLHNDYFRQVQGTVGGTETVNGQTTSQVDASTVSHTFTIQSTPNSANPLYVSVPVVGVAADAPDNVNIEGNPYPTPNIIEFQFRTGPAGTYIWHCYDPCGSGLEGSNAGFGGPMATTGYMAGTLTVV